jgi:hypothetical protein
MSCTTAPLLLPDASAWTIANAWRISSGNIGLPSKSNVSMVHLLEGPHFNIHESRRNFFSFNSGYNIVDYSKR